MATQILLLARNDTDSSVTFAIDGQRYEYILNPAACDTVDYLCRKVSNGKALAYAKRRATRTERLT